MAVTRDEVCEESKQFYLRTGQFPDTVYFPQECLEDLMSDFDQWASHDKPPRKLVGCRVIYHDGPLRFTLEGATDGQEVRRS